MEGNKKINLLSVIGGILSISFYLFTILFIWNYQDVIYFKIAATSFLSIIIVGKMKKTDIEREHIKELEKKNESLMRDIEKELNNFSNTTND